jgi:hypothetical protein
MREMTGNQLLKLTRCRYFIHAGKLTVEVTKKALREAMRQYKKILYGKCKDVYTVDLSTFEGIIHRYTARERTVNYYTAVILL